MIIDPRYPTRWKPSPWPWTWAALAEPYASIARDCVFLVPMWEDGGNQKCVVTRTTLTRVAGTTNGAGPFGRSLNRTDGTLDHLLGPAGFRPIQTPDNGFTIFGVADPAPSSTTAGSGSLFLMRRTNPWIQYGVLINFYISGADGNSGAASSYNQASNGVVDTYSVADSSGVDGRWHAYASRYDGATPAQIWRDGILRGTAALIPSATISDAAQTLIIGGLNASGYGIIGGIGLVSAWDRPLTDWEMRALHDDPMGLVRPSVLRTFFVPSIPSTPTQHNLVGALVSPKPTVSGTLTQTFPARSVSGALISAKPRAVGTLTQTFPARSVSGAIVSAKPRASGTLTQTFPARSISGGVVSRKPIAAGTLTQSGIAPHAVSGIMVSKKPQISGGLSQVGIPPHVLSGGAVSSKPIAVGALTQSSITPHAISGGMVSKKPIVSGSLIQFELSSHSVSGEMVSSKPQISGTLSQGVISPHALLVGLVSPKPIVVGIITDALGTFSDEFSDEFDKGFRSVSGALGSPKPTASGLLFQGALFGYEFYGDVISPKPRIEGSLTQTLLPSNFSGSLVSAKPRIVGSLTQTPLPNFFTASLVSPKPTMSGGIAQGQIGSSSFYAGLVSPKPRISGSLTQSAIAARTFSGSLFSPKPRVSGTLVQQALGGIGMSGGLVSPKPRMVGILTQTFPARSILGGMVSKKPGITASLTQTILPHTIGGGMVSSRPRLSASFVQNLLTPHVISGGMVSPKPRVKAVPMADEYAIKVGIEYATKGQLALASGYLLLLATDEEGELPMAHPLAIAQRTVEAGYGGNPLTFEGPLDPAELKYFTVTWDTELQAATDSIVPDNGTVEGQSVFLTLSGAAVSAGVQVHAFSQDSRSVTFWLKVDPTQKNRTEWNGAGELHIITVRIITTRGQIFERDISFRVKQL